MVLNVGMDTCQWCFEEIGEERRCSSCGRIQYKYALDEGTNDAVARTTASDTEQNRIDDLYGREDVLEEIAEMLGTVAVTPRAAPPPLQRSPRMEPQAPPPRTPSRVRRSSDPSSPQQTPITPRQAKASVGCLVSFLLLGLGIAFFVTVVNDSGSASGDFSGNATAFIIPAILVVAIIRRRLNRRD